MSISMNTQIRGRHTSQQHCMTAELKPSPCFLAVFFFFSVCLIWASPERRLGLNNSCDSLFFPSKSCETSSSSAGQQLAEGKTETGRGFSGVKWSFSSSPPISSFSSCNLTVKVAHRWRSRWKQGHEVTQHHLQTDQCNYLSPGDNSKGQKHFFVCHQLCSE